LPAPGVYEDPTTLFAIMVSHFTTPENCDWPALTFIAPALASMMPAFV
jgi:hypothetical protein